MHFAASHGHTAAVNALLAAGADKALANDKGQLPADLSVAYPVCQEALAPSPVELQDLAVGAVDTVGAVGEGPIAAVAMADLYVEAAAAVQASVAEASAEAASSGEEFAAEGQRVQRRAGDEVFEMRMENGNDYFVLHMENRLRERYNLPSHPRLELHRHNLPREAKNRPNIDWQEQIHRGFLRGLRNISETA